MEATGVATCEDDRRAGHTIAISTAWRTCKMASADKRERKAPARKKTGNSSKSVLRGVVGGGGAATDTLLDFVERLGLVDIVLGRVKARIEETDIDELIDEVAEYLRRNPEVLVVSLGAV